MDLYMFSCRVILPCYTVVSQRRHQERLPPIVDLTQCRLAEDAACAMQLWVRCLRRSASIAFQELAAAKLENCHSEIITTSAGMRRKAKERGAVINGLQGLDSQLD